MYFSFLIVLIAESIFLNVASECPNKIKMKIDEHCYSFETNGMTFNDANTHCANLGGRITSVMSPKVLRRVQKLVEKTVLDKLKNSGVFWIGIKMDDTSLSKAVRDREWSVDWDESKFVQRDYKFWDTDGGPTDKGLTCAAINGSNEWKVMAVDCGGPRFGILCMMKEGETCRHKAVPYLEYYKYCLAFVGASEYNKIHSFCGTYIPTPYQNEEMNKAVKMAAKNSFLNGGVFMNIKRNGPQFVELSNGMPIPEELWGEGEPRDEYDCVGLSIQDDNKLKLKTMSCDFQSFFLCIAERMY